MATELTPFITKLIQDGIITQEQIDSKQLRIDSINEAFGADSEVRRILLYGGARSSKTFRSTNKIIVRALHYPGSRHLIARDTYAAVRSSMLEDTFPKLLRLKYPTLYKLFTKTSRKEVIKVGMNWGTSTFIFPNGSMIVFKGIGNEKDVEKLLGTEYMSILMDEANMVNYLSVQKLRTRLAQKCYHYKTGKEGKLLEIDICNPPSKSSWLYKEYFQLINPLDPEVKLYANEYFHCQLNPIDNIENIPEDFIIQLTRLPKAQQKRFLFGEFSDIVDGGIFSNEIALNLHKIGLFKRNPAYETFAVFDIGHCLQKEIEVLTSTGKWKSIADVTEEDLIAVVDENHNTKFEHVKPTKHYFNKAYKITGGSGQEIIASNKHKFRISIGHGKEKTLTVEELKERKSRNEILRNSHSGYQTNRDLYDDLLNIMIAADGLTPYEGKNYYSTRVIIKDKEKKKRIETLFNTYFSKKDYSNGFTRYSFKLPKTRNWKSLDGIKLEGLSQHDAKILADEFPQWDGSYNCCFNSIHKEQIDKVHAILLLAGYNPNHTKPRKCGKSNNLCYGITWSINKQNNYFNIKDIQEIDWNDYLYCITTSTGYFIARDKNKKTFISHNSDATSLIIFQYINNNWFVLDYLEETQKTWPYFSNWIKSKHPYVKRIIFPHDGEVTEWGAGTTRRARAEEDGFQVLIAPKMRQMNQIDLARDNLFNCRFNEETTRRLWECVSNATWEHNKENYQFDRAKMEHDEFSHGTSAFIYMITGILKWVDPKQYLTDEERKKELQEEANKLINKAIDQDMDKVLNPGFDLAKIRNNY